MIEALNFHTEDIKYLDGLTISTEAENTEVSALIWCLLVFKEIDEVNK